MLRCPWVSQSCAVQWPKQICSVQLPWADVCNCTKSRVDFPWINKCSELTALVPAKCSIFKTSSDRDVNGVGVRNGQAAPKITKRSIWSYYPPWILFPVSVDDWPWSVLWLWSGLWAAQTLAERPSTTQLGTACHSWPAAQADGQ